MLTGAQQASPSDVGKISSAQQTALGARVSTPDGREFRYIKAGGTALAIGKLCQQPAVVANHQVCAVAEAAAVGAKRVKVTLGATAATADQYAGGFVNVTDSAGAGQSLLAAGNAAIDSSGSGYIELAEPVTTALTTSSKVNLTISPFNGCIISSSSVTTELIVGVPQIAITAAYYGWAQIRGLGSVLVNGTPAAGAGLTASATTAGATDVEGTSTVTQRIGRVYNTTAVSTKYPVTYLEIQ